MAKRLLSSTILVLVIVLIALAVSPSEAEAALAFNSGFESGNTFEWDVVTGTPSTQAVIKNTGSYALYSNTTNAECSVTKNSLANMRMTLYLYINSAPTDAVGFALACGGGYIGITANRYLESGWGVNVGSTQLALQKWYRVSASNGGSGSYFKVYLDGAVEITETGTDPVVSALSVGVQGATVTASIYIDDVAVDNTASTSDIGDIRTLLSLPVGQGSNSGFDYGTPNNTAATRWANTNDTPGNISDTSYSAFTAATGTGADTYDLKNASTIGLGATETIQAVRSLIRAARSGGSSATHNTSVYDNSTLFNTAFTSTSFTWYSRYDTLAPPGGARTWTQTNFNAFEAGGNHSTAGGQDTQISAIMVMVGFYRVPGNPSGLASPAQTSVSVNLTWTKGTQADNTTIRYKTGAYPDNVTDGSEGYRGTASSAQVTGLSASTTYYFRAWAYATPSGLYSTGTSDLTQATPSTEADITNTPSDRAFGTVALSSTYWAFGANTTAPSWPLADAQCYFSVTNNSAFAVNITIHGHDWTGTGTNWTLGASPNTNTVRERVWKSGDAAVSNNVTVTTSNQAFINNLAASDHKHWELAIDTPTSVSDGNLKSDTITLTATAA